ncbi:MAG: hypothetical protein V7724_06525 [Sediminicola sp.]|tara:strand:+ start:16731 stop:17000 length:270 start_codon:yes stop_codon:yes gene_type:complete
MKYKVVVEGGIIGAPRSYEGEINMGPMEENTLLAALKEVVKPNNDRLRDGFSYKVTVEGDGEYIRSDYDDSNIPNTVLEFVQKIRNHSQ